MGVEITHFSRRCGNVRKLQFRRVNCADVISKVHIVNTEYIICIRVCKHKWTIHRKCIWFSLWAQKARVRGTVARGEDGTLTYFKVLFLWLLFWQENLTVIRTIPVLQLLAVTSHERRSPCVFWPLQNSLFTKLQFSSYWEWWLLHLSFLVTTFLSKRTLLRDLRRSSFAESFMHGMQYLFNKDFSFSESHLAFFCPQVMESNNDRLISINLPKIVVH